MGQDDVIHVGPDLTHMCDHTWGWLPLPCWVLCMRHEL